MIERFKGIETHEQNTPISKAVVILFPDIRTTGDKNSHQDYTSILSQDFRDATDALLMRYQRLGFNTIGVVYRDTDSNTFSFLYPQSQLQNTIKWDKTFSDWSNNQDKFRQFYETGMKDIFKHINLKDKAEVVVGGYHAKDCVAKFTAFLRTKGFRATVDLKLTNELPFLLISRRLRKMLPVEMRRKHAKEDRFIWTLMKEDEEEIIKKQ